MGLRWAISNHLKVISNYLKPPPTISNHLKVISNHLKVQANTVWGWLGPVLRGDLCREGAECGVCAKKGGIESGLEQFAAKRAVCAAFAPFLAALGEDALFSGKALHSAPAHASSSGDLCPGHLSPLLPGTLRWFEMLSS